MWKIVEKKIEFSKIVARKEIDKAGQCGYNICKLYYITGKHELSKAYFDANIVSICEHRRVPHQESTDAFLKISRDWQNEMVSFIGKNGISIIKSYHENRMYDKVIENGLRYIESIHTLSLPFGAISHTIDGSTLLHTNVKKTIASAVYRLFLSVDTNETKSVLELRRKILVEKTTRLVNRHRNVLFIKLIFTTMFSQANYRVDYFLAFEPFVKAVKEAGIEDCIIITMLGKWNTNVHRWPSAHSYLMLSLPQIHTEEQKYFREGALVELFVMKVENIGWKNLNPMEKGKKNIKNMNKLIVGLGNYYPNSDYIKQLQRRYELIIDEKNRILQ